jgi:hypothetical protein
VGEGLGLGEGEGLGLGVGLGVGVPPPFAPGFPLLEERLGELAEIPPQATRDNKKEKPNNNIQNLRMPIRPLRVKRSATPSRCAGESSCWPSCCKKVALGCLQHFALQVQVPAWTPPKEAGSSSGGGSGSTCASFQSHPYGPLTTSH